MALKTARSTPAQRQALLRLHADLDAALESLPGRFWVTQEQSQAYVMVLAHLQRWAGFESEKVENDDESRRST